MAFLLCACADRITADEDLAIASIFFPPDRRLSVLVRCPDDEFIWHHHDVEDELFLVVKGVLRMKFRDHEAVIREGEFVIVPHGVEHCPVADEEVHVVLIEPKSTLNTGNIVNERTVAPLESI